MSLTKYKKYNLLHYAKKKFVIVFPWYRCATYVIWKRLDKLTNNEKF